MNKKEKKYRLVKHHSDVFKDWYFIDYWNNGKWFRIGCDRLANCKKNYPCAEIIDKYITP
jgi:hypothetical protein